MGDGIAGKLPLHHACAVASQVPQSRLGEQSLKERIDCYGIAIDCHNAHQQRQCANAPSPRSVRHAAKPVGSKRAPCRTPVPKRFQIVLPSQEPQLRLTILDGEVYAPEGGSAERELASGDAGDGIVGKLPLHHAYAIEDIPADAVPAEVPVLEVAENLLSPRLGR